MSPSVILDGEHNFQHNIDNPGLTDRPHSVFNFKMIICRFFVQEGFELFAAQSFSKNFGLYSKYSASNQIYPVQVSSPEMFPRLVI